MSRNPQTQKLIQLVEPVLVASGYELVDLRLLLEQGGWVLRIAVDRPLDPALPPSEVPQDRVDLSACEEISRELSAVLDVADPIPQAYALEISSPGIERPLRTAAHYAYYAGSEARIQMAIGVSVDGSSERKNFRGQLQGVEGDKVAILVDGQTFHLPIDDIEQAKLVPDWDAVMRGGTGVGAPPPKPVKPGHRPSAKPKQGTPPKQKRN